MVTEKTRLLVAHLHLSSPDFEDSYQICLYILTAWHSALWMTKAQWLLSSVETNLSQVFSSTYTLAKKALSDYCQLHQSTPFCLAFEVVCHLVYPGHPPSISAIPQCTSFSIYLEHFLKGWPPGQCSHLLPVTFAHALFTQRWGSQFQLSFKIFPTS